MKNEDNRFKWISKKWKEKSDSQRENKIIRDESEREPGKFLSDHITSSEYGEAQVLMEEFCKKYTGKPIEEVIPGEVVESEMGMCYRIEGEDTIDPTFIDSNDAREKILSNLKLIYGIGEITEEKLRKDGYLTIEDLLNHPRFHNDASKFLNMLEKCDLNDIIGWISHWCSQSDPLVLCSSSFHKLENFKMLDIETMGLFNRVIILIGMANIKDNKVLINQYIIRDIEEEPGILSEFLAGISDESVIVTFNGKSFDIPYIKERLAYYGIFRDIRNPHFDILHFSRRAWKEDLPDCTLDTLEKSLFGVERENDVPSALVPDFFERFLRSGNPGPLIPIIKHNRQDLITLANLFSRLHEEWK